MRAVRYDDMAALAAIQDSGFGDWGPPLVIDRAMVEDFLRIAGTGPLDGPVPGFLLASILPRLSPPRDWQVEGYRSAVNLGCPVIRFPDPVAIGAAIRCRSRLVEARPHPRGTVMAFGFEARADHDGQACLLCTIEVLYLGGAS
ncbi:hypothetical protein [Sphingobium estronivorans]|uniref:hypothetical protein n=1 Tax=Sphingobium estronivorans TaxID=1577690 RepID=UPI00123A37F0|nr:hypothetical protein [Sphingobium estronivorans]